MKTLYYGFYSEETFKNLPPSSRNRLVIVVTDSIHKELYKNNKNVLFLPCLDIRKEGLQTNKFQECHLLKLYFYLLQNNFEELVVHCNAGISRSPAILIGIFQILGWYQLAKEIENRKDISPNQEILSIFQTYQIPIIHHQFSKAKALNQETESKNIETIQKILKINR